MNIICILEFCFCLKSVLYKHFPNFFSVHKNCLFSIAFIPHLFKLLFQAKFGKCLSKILTKLLMPFIVVKTYNHQMSFFSGKQKLL